MGLKLVDYNKAFAEYHSVINYNNFNSKTRKQHKARLRFEYNEVLKMYNLHFDKKRISKKQVLIQFSERLGWNGIISEIVKISNFVTQSENSVQ